MTISPQRRTWLKGALATLATGLLPSILQAAWSKETFQKTTVDAAIQAVFGPCEIIDTQAITVRAPDIAENGAVVPVTVKTDQPGVETIAILAAGNNQPLVSTFTLGTGAIADVSARIKMAKTADVIAVVKVGDKLYRNHKNVKVTIGGCGG